MSTSSTSSSGSDQEVESKKPKKSKLDKKKAVPTKKMKQAMFVDSSSSSDEEVIKKKKQKHAKKKVHFEDEDNEKKMKKQKKMSHVKDTPHVKTPKKSKKPTTQESMEVENSTRKMRPKKKGILVVEEDHDDKAVAAKKITVPKKDQEITVPEMTRLLSRFVDSVDEPMISSMKKNNPTLFDQFVFLMEPYRSQWLYSTQAGKLFKFVPDKKSKDGGGEFVCITEDPRLMVLTHYTKKEDFPLDELYKQYAKKHLPEKGEEEEAATEVLLTKEEKLFQFISGNAKMCAKVCFDHKMQRLILHSKKDSKSYWVNSPEGREKLGLVINIRPRKMDENTIANEIDKLVRTRKNILHLLDGGSIESMVSPPAKKSSPGKLVNVTFVIDDHDNDEKESTKSSKKTKKATVEKKIKIDINHEKEKKKKKKKKEKKKDSNESTSEPDKKSKKSSKKRKIGELESSPSPPRSLSKSTSSSSHQQSSSTTTTSTKKSKTQHNNEITPKPKPKPKPTQPVRTVVTSISIDDDMINKIKQMNSNQLRAMLDDEKKKVEAIDRETLERIEWFERYSVKAC
jgi:hypothetical protein